MTDSPGNKGEESPIPANVVVVFGVSGSGKTTIASLLAQQLGWTFEDADWFHPPANVEKMSHGTPLTDEDRKPWLEAIARWIGATAEAGRHGVIACSALKRVYREMLVAGHREAVYFAFLDGSKELIGTRMALRHDHFMPTSLLDSQFAALERPGPDERVVTVSIEPRPREIVDNIIAELEARADR